MEVPSKPVDPTIIQVYAPTSASTEVEIDDFYELLQTKIDEAQRRNRNTRESIGDFKVNVGECAHNTNTTGLGEGNERDEKLVEFCIDNSLTITNTKFNRHKRRRYT